MAANVTNTVVNELDSGTLRIVKGQFNTAASQTNIVDLAVCGPAGNTYDSGIRLTKDSVIFCTFKTNEENPNANPPVIAVPAALAYSSVISSTEGRSKFVVTYDPAPAAGIAVNFCIIG